MPLGGANIHINYNKIQKKSNPDLAKNSFDIFFVGIFTQMIMFE